MSACHRCGYVLLYLKIDYDYQIAKVTMKIHTPIKHKNTVIRVLHRKQLFQVAHKFNTNIYSVCVFTDQHTISV